MVSSVSQHAAAHVCTFGELCSAAVTANTSSACNPSKHDEGQRKRFRAAENWEHSSISDTHSHQLVLDNNSSAPLRCVGDAVDSNPIFRPQSNEAQQRCAWLARQARCHSTLHQHHRTARLRRPRTRHSRYTRLLTQHSTLQHGAQHTRTCKRAHALKVAGSRITWVGSRFRTWTSARMTASGNCSRQSEARSSARRAPDRPTAHAPVRSCPCPCP